MKPEIIPMLVCPNCGKADLRYVCFRGGTGNEVYTGVVWCSLCHGWYPVIDGVLELLSGKVAYPFVRQEFWNTFGHQLMEIGLEPDDISVWMNRESIPQLQQQRHSDWYADNEQQSYDEYEQMPFWLAVDALVFDEWKRSVVPDSTILDMGCGQGRSTFRFMDLDVQIIAFDISRKLVQRAHRRYSQGKYLAQASFIVADASYPPFVDACFDYILVYGVLHHLPDPRVACQQIARLLRPGGIYFGCENNKTMLRKAFDALQRLRPLWYEEAGSNPLISEADLVEWFSCTGVVPACQTRVFLPPHIVNLLGFEKGRRSLRFVDRVMNGVPFMRSCGGLIIIKAEKAGLG